MKRKHVKAGILGLDQRMMLIRIICERIKSWLFVITLKEYTRVVSHFKSIKEKAGKLKRIIKTRSLKKRLKYQTLE